MCYNSNVILTATGYEQEGSSISVPNGTKVSYEVSHTNYYKKTGELVVNSSESIKIPLIKVEEIIDIAKEDIEKRIGKKVISKANAKNKQNLIEEQ